MSYSYDQDDDAFYDYVQLADTRQVARKEHRCDGCRRTIAVGERYRRRFAIVEGEPYTEKTCRQCEDGR